MTPTALLERDDSPIRAAAEVLRGAVGELPDCLTDLDLDAPAGRLGLFGVGETGSHR
jgi:hypothetical protein